MARNKLTLEQKKKAVEIAQNGGDPLKFLEKCGSKNPSAAWFYIKKTIEAKGKKIEVPEATLGDAMAGMQEATNNFFGACKDMGLNVETPEQPAPVQDDKPDAVRFQIMTIRGEFGEYRISDDDFIYTGAFGDVKGVAEDLGAWLEEMKRAAQMLEVGA